MKLTAQDIIDKRRELWDQHRDLGLDTDYRQKVAEYMLQDTAEAKALRLEVRENPEYIIEMFMVIVDKEQQTVPFFLNAVQQEFMQTLHKAKADYAAGKRLHLKFLVLKGRQQGFTTVITGYQLACAITQQNFSGYTVADNADNTNTIFEKKAKFPYSNLPEAVKPTEKYNNRKEFLFAVINSNWAINTAGNKDVGRSMTLNFFHGSEAAFWPSISNIITGLGEALTKSSIQILESTANGYNEYKDMWDAAGDNGPGDNTWQRLFYQWWRTPEYSQRYESDRAKETFEKKVVDEDGDSPAEQRVMKKLHGLQKTYKLTWGQLYWYYNKWKGYIDKEKILQEYPCEPEEAFLASGRCVFNKEILVSRIAHLRALYKQQQPKVGHFQFKWHDPETRDYILDSSIEFVEAQDGIVTLYEEPKIGYPYAIGGDTKGEGKDFYAGTVINNVTGMRVAIVHAQFTNSKPFTWQMYCLGMYYNQATIAIEMNFNTGPIEELDRLHYPKQYVRVIRDKIGNPYDKRFGWKTDGNTRPLIIDREVSLIEEHIELFTHIGMLQECLTFVYDENNRPDAEEGKHDDILFSDMIAEEARNQQSREIEQAPQPRRKKLIEKLGLNRDTESWRTM
jgi:hypothetical protein